MTDEETQERIGLCLSGGGFRASFYALGALRYLAEGGHLPRVEVISAVSGGSIAAASVADGWTRFLAGGGDLDAFLREIDAPFRTPVTTKNLRNRWVGASLVPRRGGRGAALGRTLEKHLYRARRVSDLPSTPQVIFTSTDLGVGRAFRIAHDFVGSYDHGYVEPAPDALPLGISVVSSAAFPGVADRRHAAERRPAAPERAGEAAPARRRRLRQPRAGVVPGRGLRAALERPEPAVRDRRQRLRRPAAHDEAVRPRQGAPARPGHPVRADAEPPGPLARRPAPRPAGRRDGARRLHRHRPRPARRRPSGSLRRRAAERPGRAARAPAHRPRPLLAGGGRPALLPRVLVAPRAPEVLRARARRRRARVDHVREPVAGAPLGAARPAPSRSEAQALAPQLKAAAARIPWPGPAPWPRG